MFTFAPLGLTKRSIFKPNLQVMIRGISGENL